MTKKKETEREVPEKEVEVEVSHEEHNSTKEDPNSIDHTAQEAFDTVYQYARDIPAEAIAYGILALGLILLPFHHLLGGVFIGIIFGVYFCEEAIISIRALRDYIEHTGRVKSVVLGGTFLALLIVIPTLFLSAAATIGVLSLLRSNKKPNPPRT